ASPKAVVLRLAAVYGPRMKGNYARLLRALRRGLFVPVGAGHNRRTLVHEADVAQALLLAAEHPAAPGQVFNVTDGTTPPFRAILAAMAAAVGRTPPRLHLPVAPLRLALAGLERGVGLVGKRSPLGPATLAKLLEDVAVSGAKIQRELGFHPTYDIASGWRETVRQINILQVSG
nr:NAD-dependent epimerase/dehydratase family protein [Chloroflexaceae bacterium]